MPSALRINDIGVTLLVCNKVGLNGNLMAFRSVNQIGGSVLVGDQLLFYGDFLAGNSVNDIDVSVFINHQITGDGHRFTWLCVNRDRGLRALGFQICDFLRQVLVFLSQVNNGLLLFGFLVQRVKLSVQRDRKSVV